MATNTPNYNLVKPDYADFADVAVAVNGNMDIIDTALAQANNSTALAQLTQRVDSHVNDLAIHNQFNNGAQRVLVRLGWNNTLNCPTMEYVEVSP